MEKESQILIETSLGNITIKLYNDFLGDFNLISWVCLDFY